MRVLNFLDGFESTSAPEVIGFAATGISVTPSGNLTSTNVQAALTELQTDVDTRATTTALNTGLTNSANALTTHEADTSTHGVSQVVGASESQVITNKDIDGGTASNANRITLPKNTLTNLQGLTRKEGTLVYDTVSGRPFFDNGTNLQPVGSGSGSGGINYITNPDSETDTTDWATYSDTAGVAPVDGTGGTANITWTRTTVSPLRGNASFILTKDGFDRRGQGASFAFTLARADFARVLTVSFDYEVVSGTYADGDLRVYIVADVAGTPTVIEPTGTRILNNIGPARHTCTFQTHASATAYRLVIHCSSASASSYVIEFENIVCGPQSQAIGAFVGDWQSFTPTWTASTTNPVIGNGSISGRWRRVGDTAEVTISVISGTTTTYGTGTYTFSLPSGMTIDLTKALESFGTANMYRNASGFNDWIGRVLANGTTAVRVIGSIGNSLWSNTVPTTLDASTANHLIALNFAVPILGWSSGQVLSSDTDTRVVAARGSGNPNSTLVSGSPTKATWASNPLWFDTHGAWDAVNNRYIVPVPGIYRFSWTTEASATWIAGNAFIARIANATTAQALESATRVPVNVTTTICVVVTGTLSCRAGDVIEFFANATGSTPTWSSAIQGSRFEIERLSGPAQIAASETVAFRASTSAGQSIANSSASASCVFGTVGFSTHGTAAYDPTTGIFTAPVAGVYTISASTTWSANGTGERACYIAINGGLTFNFGKRAGVASFQIACNGSVTTRLNAGDTVSVRPFQTSGGALALSINPDENFFSVVRNGV